MHLVRHSIQFFREALLLPRQTKRSACRPYEALYGSSRKSSRVAAGWHPQTGGRLFEVNRLKQLPGITSKLSEWLRKQYVLAYALSNTHKNSGYRHVQVKSQEQAISATTRFLASGVLRASRVVAL